MIQAATTSALKKSDLVVVISGRDKGKKGKIQKFLPEKGRALVEKLNLVKRHAKPTKENPQGGIVDKEASIHVSNLMFYCDACGKGVRLGASQKDKKKIRICRKCGKEAK